MLASARAGNGQQEDRRFEGTPPSADGYGKLIAGYAKGHPGRLVNRSRYSVEASFGFSASVPSSSCSSRFATLQRISSHDVAVRLQDRRPSRVDVCHQLLAIRVSLIGMIALRELKIGQVKLFGDSDGTSPADHLVGPQMISQISRLCASCGRASRVDMRSKPVECSARGDNHRTKR